MRLPLATLEVFTAIARHGSLRAAANALELKPSTVSHQLKTLEAQVGTALFIRTTRSVNLTEAGRVLYEGTGPAFDQLAQALEQARSTGQVPRGTLKLEMPEFIYDMLVGKVLSRFCNDYPEIDVELSLTDGMANINQQEMHAGFRLGDRLAEGMVAVRLTPPLPLCVAASPAYLDQHGRPETPEDLLQHNCIRYRFHTSGRLASWEFGGTDGAYHIEVGGSLIVNTLPSMVDLAKQGLGLTYLFRHYCEEALNNEELIPVLDEHLNDLPGIYIYFPREYRNMVPLRLFIERLQRESVTDL